MTDYWTTVCETYCTEGGITYLYCLLDERAWQSGRAPRMTQRGPRATLESRPVSHYWTGVGNRLHR